MKKLPMAMPTITSYPKHANLIAILRQHPSYNDWLYLNYIQLQADFNQGVFWIDFYQPLSRLHYPLMEREALRKATFFANSMSILSFICNSIDRQGYVYLYIDTYYISAYGNSGREHFPHDMLIYGYDAKSRVMYIADFFRGAYALTEASFEEVERAFHSPHISTYPEFVDIQLLRVLPEEKMVFDRSYCVQLMRDYVEATNSSHRLALIEAPRDEKTFYFGSAVYTPLMAHMESISPAYEVLRALHVLADHKKLMYERAAFFLNTGILTGSSHGALLAQLEAIKDEALTIRNVYLKSMVKRTKDSSILGRLKALREIEARVIAEFADQLEASGAEKCCLPS